MYNEDLSYENIIIDFLNKGFPKFLCVENYFEFISTYIKQKI